MMDCAIDCIPRNVRPWANQAIALDVEKCGDRRGARGGMGGVDRGLILGVGCLRKKQLVWKHGDSARRWLLPALETG